MKSKKLGRFNSDEDNIDEIGKVIKEDYNKFRI